jgi:heterodisulfide reductase subunit B
MNYIAFGCCFTGSSLKEYDASTNALLKGLGLGVKRFREFGCCGYPLKNVDYKASLTAAARNLALAEAKGLPLLTLCSCCYGNLKNARNMLENDPELKAEIAGLLSREGLSYKGTAVVRHVFEVLFHDLGLEAINNKLVRNYHGLTVALQYGCQLLRPGGAMKTDEPVDPNLFERLVAATGVANAHWPMGEACCGAPVLGSMDDVASRMRSKKIDSAREAGADIICTACPFCHLQLSRPDHDSGNGAGGRKRFSGRVILFTQLLGLCLGGEPGVLGIDPVKYPRHGRLLEALQDR